MDSRFGQEQTAQELVEGEPGSAGKTSRSTEFSVVIGFAPKLLESSSLTQSAPSTLPELTISDRALAVMPNQGRLSITYEVKPEERLKEVGVRASELRSKFSAIDTDKDNYLSADELTAAGGFNRYLAKHAGKISANAVDGDSGKISWSDISALQTVSTGSDMEIRQRALGSMMSTTSGHIGLGAMAVTGLAELGCSMRGVPFNGKLRLAGYGLVLGAFAYGYYQQQNQLFSLKEHLAGDTELNPYCSSGTLNIDSNLLRFRWKLK